MNKYRHIPQIGMILGDPRGIGPEIVCKVLSKDYWIGKVRPIIIGDPDSLLKGMTVSNSSFSYIEYEFVDKFDSQICFLPIRLMAEQHMTNEQSIGEYIIECFRTAIGKTKNEEITSFVYAPISKKTLSKVDSIYNDEHALMRSLWNQKELSFEMNYSSGIWTSRVTGHIPFSQIIDSLSTELILDVIRQTCDSLKLIEGINPRVFVCAINPHASEAGLFGSEENEIISPAITEARKIGFHVDGPVPADTAFNRAFKGECDAVITMYHDQGQIALKTKQFKGGVTYFSGLPKPVFTTGHGIGSDISGRGSADEDALSNALCMLIDMIQQRQ